MLASAFVKCFKQDEQAASSTLGDSDGRQRSKQFKKVASGAMADRWFHAKVFLMWCNNPLLFSSHGHKKTRKVAEDIKGDPSHVYLGHNTVLFQLINGKADDIWADINGVLLDKSRWQDLWALVPDQEFGKVRECNITLVLGMAVQLKMRVYDKISSFPLLLFACCNKPPAEDCGTRPQLQRSSSRLAPTSLSRQCKTSPRKSESASSVRGC